MVSHLILWCLNRLDQSLPRQQVRDLNRPVLSLPPSLILWLLQAVVPKVLHNLPGILPLHRRLAVLRVLRIHLVRNLRQNRRLLAVFTYRRPAVYIRPRLKALVLSLRVNHRHLSLLVPRRRFTLPRLQVRVLKAARIRWHLKAPAPDRQFSLRSRQIVHVRQHRTQRVQNHPVARPRLTAMHTLYPRLNLRFLHRLATH